MALFDRLRGRDPVPDGNRWLVVGLRNAETRYDGTRHNVGGEVVQRLGERLGASFKAHKVSAEVADSWDRPGGVPLSLVLPFGYMNNSGGPVQAGMTFYKVPPERLVVVHDEIDLDLAKLRLKLGGGTAGHNGLRDIQRRIGTPEFHRVRIGVGRPPGRQAAADYVLKRFSGKEREEIDVTVEDACDAILDLVAHGLEHAQNRHH